MSFIWPAEINPEPTVLGRLGRVLHWAALMWGVSPALFLIGYAMTQDFGWSDAWPGILMAGAWAVAWSLIGRGVRYVLADE